MSLAGVGVLALYGKLRDNPWLSVAYVAYLAPVRRPILFCEGGYQYVHDEARVGRENHQIGWGG